MKKTSYLADFPMTEEESNNYYSILEAMKSQLRQSGSDESFINRSVEYYTLSAWLALIKTRINSCTTCPCQKFAHTYVFGTGSPTANIMFIAASPDEEADEYGIPLAGEPGGYFNIMLSRLGLNRKQIYISYICKCFPGLNKNASTSQMEACHKFLMAEIEIIRPTYIVLLGLSPAKFFDSSLKDRKIEEVIDMSLAGYRIKPHLDIPAVCVYHPKHVLFVEKRKKEVAEEMKKKQLQIISSFLKEKIEEVKDVPSIQK